MEMLFLLFLIFVSIIALQWEDFKPTRYFFIRVFRLYKFCDKYENVDDFSSGEVEQLVNFLILNTCDDRNEIVKEIRNGYELKYYPENVNANRRKMPMSYVDIHDMNAEVVIRVGFDKFDKPTYQVEYRQTKYSFKKMFFASHQGSSLDFSKQYKEDSEGIVKKYILYTMRRLL